MGLPASIDPASVARISRARYDAIVASGALEGAKVELLEGVLVDMTPQGIEHGGVIEVLAQLLRDAVGARGRVREEKPLALGEDSEPEPDIAIVPPGDPFAGLPGQAYLLVEVAETSLRKDRSAKAELYARAGVPEYWIVNLVDRVVEVHLDPEGGRYGRVLVVRRGERVTLRAFPELTIAVDRFLR